MKADPFAQRKLLDVQELDSTFEGLRHQARNPAEGPELQERTALREELKGRVRDLQVQVEDLTREQRRADQDVEHVKARRQRDQQRLDAGQVGNPKDLERLQSELVSLERRISDLEDVELEVMERLEAAQQELEGTRDQLVEVEQRITELTASRDARREELKREAADLRARREPLIAQIPEALLSLYERLREQKGGVGAAALRARRCSGCSLQLDNQVLAEMASQPPDVVLRCEECGRILVRTPESGL
jgi:predicted  nucleic acid-binding Zn-ribbon protein